MNGNVNEIQVGAKIEYHGRYPWHIYGGVVVGEAEDSLMGPSWQVRWDGDQYFPERAGTLSLVPKFISSEIFRVVSEVRK